MKELIKLLDEEERFVFNKGYEPFIIRFISKGVHIMDFYDLSFSVERVHFGYVDYNGQHHSNSIDIEEYKEWKDKLLNEK